MPTDDLGSIWTGEPVRISQAIKPVGKELDREKNKQEKPSNQEREEDVVELSTETPPVPKPNIQVKNQAEESSVEIAGRNIDVTVG